MKYLFSKEGNWYKANLHSHCTVSDGVLSPEEVKEKYKAQGYSIYAYSDHHVLVPHPELKDEAFLPITSVEASIKDFRDPDNDERQTYHLNFYAKNERCDRFVDFPRLELQEKREYSVEIINDLIRRANEAGFLSQYNHPFWSTQTVKDFGPLEGLWGFEVFNGGSQVQCRGWGDQQFVEMMWEGKYLCPTAGDDNHGSADVNNPTDDSFRCFTMIRAKELEYDTVLKAMEEGQLYASTGPTIEEITVEGNKVTVKTSPACKILLREQYRGYLAATSREDDLTEAVFDLEKFRDPPRYIRFEIWDTHNNRAITRAFFPEEWRESSMSAPHATEIR
ncbi:MAG: PHP domain-containing protein [Clostridia bacterium]|nr:PHP domain-containing protein [Clostridia bacterium]